MSDDPMVNILNRLDAQFTAAGFSNALPHEEALGLLIAERDRLRRERDALQRAINEWCEADCNPEIGDEASRRHYRGVHSLRRFYTGASVHVRRATHPKGGAS